MGERFFSPGSLIWRVDREMVLLLGGGRALLMQLAHPKVAAGVADHSHFRQDPLGRLHRTMSTMWSIVFDDRPAAQASLQRVNEIHHQVQGTVKRGEPLPIGTPYGARDPDLLFWVHATLVDSALLAYELFFHPLTREERARYYEETKRLAALFEIPEEKIPPSLESFDTYVRSMIQEGPLAVGPVAQAISRDILHPRPWILKIGGPVHALITAGLLPERLRQEYGLRWNPHREKMFRILAKSIRRLLPLVPGPCRVVPHARAAEKKLRRSNLRQPDRP